MTGQPRAARPNVVPGAHQAMSDHGQQLQAVNDRQANAMVQARRQGGNAEHQQRRRQGEGDEGGHGAPPAGAEQADGRPIWLLAGPGTHWQTASSWANWTSSSQRRRCTTSWRKYPTCAIGPPNAVSPSVRNTPNTSAAVPAGGEVAMGPGAGGDAVTGGALAKARR